MRPHHAARCNGTPQDQTQLGIAQACLAKLPKPIKELIALVNIVSEEKKIPFVQIYVGLNKDWNKDMGSNVYYKIYC